MEEGTNSAWSVTDRAWHNLVATLPGYDEEYMYMYTLIQTCIHYYLPY